MEINSGHSNVQIAIAVQPQNPASRAQKVESDYSFDDNSPITVVQTPTSPTLNTRGQEVGSLINTWA